MATLPIFNTTDKSLSLLQTSWKAILAPFLRNKLLDGQILNNVQLLTGTNVVNHKLGRPLQGWIVVGQNASASIYDAQASNNQSDLTLILVTSASVTVNLYVF